MNEAAEALARIETLIATLESQADASARRPARELLEVVLDLHGLALARLASIIAGEANGAALFSRLAEDRHVRAVLLLHGLHPDEIAVRVGRAIAELNHDLAARGVRLRMAAVGANTARLVVHHEPGTHRLDASLREQIEAVIVEAAPELDELIIDGPDLGADETMPEVRPALAN
jgi:hypothetical protein